MIRVLAICLAFAGPAVAASKAPTFADSVAAFIREVDARPDSFAVRAERAWRALCGPGMAAPSTPEDARLRAYYFHRLMREYGAMRRDAAGPAPAGFDARLREQFASLRRRFVKTETEMREGPDSLTTQGPGRFRFLAAEALLRKDTAKAFEAYRSGWRKFGLEDDFLDLFALRTARGGASDSLIEAGLRELPGAPATRAAIFNAWMARGDSAGSRKALDLATQAQAEWDRSPEWKIRQARALLACGRGKQAEAPLMRALDLLDEAQPVAGESARMRKEIFALVDSARKAKGGR